LVLGWAAGDSADASQGYISGISWDAATGAAAVLGSTIITNAQGGVAPTGSSFYPAYENNNGIAVGSVEPVIDIGTQYPTYSAAVAVGGGATLLPNEEAAVESYATGINNLNPPLVPGTVWPSSDPVAVLWMPVNGTWTEKNLGAWIPASGSANGYSSELLGWTGSINDRCEIVGEFIDSNYNYLGGLIQNFHLIDLDSRTVGSGYYGFSPSQINNNGVMLANATRASDGQSVSVLLLPVELMVDADRNGQMSATDESIHNMDSTTAAIPYRFWVNDDQDCIIDEGSAGASYEEAEQIPPWSLDKDAEHIRTKRDLEDWARLWINMKGAAAMVQGNTGISVGLQFQPISGSSWPSGSPTPSIKICEAYETDGGIQYLTDDTTAGQQISGEYDVPVEDASGTGNSIVGTSPFMLPNSFWSDVDDDHPKHLIFEGVSAGQGQLVLVFYQGNQKIGEGGAVYMNIKEFTDMYDRAQANTNTTVPNNTTSTYSITNTATPASNESKQLIVFVHGINDDNDDYIADSNTFYKRLVCRGYTGHFASFRWPSPKSTLHPYNLTEYIAFKSGAAMKSYLDYLHGLGEFDTINVAAHSGGAMVVDEAIQQGGSIENYALMHASSSAKSYDGNNAALNYPYLADRNAAYPTPDANSLGGYNNCFSQPARRVNFYNENDGVLTYWWVKNQYWFRPDGGVGWTYWFDGVNCFYTTWTTRTLTDQFEIMSYVARSRSRAVGAQGTAVGGALTGGTISSNIGLEDGNFGFSGPLSFTESRSDHSGEFERSIQLTGPFYYNLLTYGFLIPNMIPLNQ
jgi:hypothetical protein